MIKIICESNENMTVKEFLEAIRDTYHKYFPNSLCSAKLTTGFGKTIYIDCLLANSANEVSNGIWGNDAFRIRFAIDMPRDITLDDEMPVSEMTADQNSFRIKPENKYMYCDAKRVPYRKVTGDTKKLISTFDKFVQKLHTMAETELNNGNLLDSDVKLFTAKL